jgi:hypothetical protein
MESFNAPKGVGIYVSTTLAILLASNVVWAGEDVCQDAGLTGKGFGLCTAYCEAMDCDSESPNANVTACGEVQSKFLETTGLGEMPCGTGTGEPPVSELACPCDFGLDTWLASGELDSLNLQYPEKACVVTSEVAVLTLTNGSGDAFQMLSAISDSPGEQITSVFSCGAIIFTGGSLTLSPEPLGAVDFLNAYDSGRRPAQDLFHQACKLDLVALITSAYYPNLVCDE